MWGRVRLSLWSFQYNAVRILPDGKRKAPCVEISNAPAIIELCKEQSYQWCYSSTLDTFSPQHARIFSWSHKAKAKECLQLLRWRNFHLRKLEEGRWDRLLPFLRKGCECLGSEVTKAWAKLKTGNGTLLAWEATSCSPEYLLESKSGLQKKRKQCSWRASCVAWVRFMEVIIVSGSSEVLENLMTSTRSLWPGQWRLKRKVI